MREKERLGITGPAFEEGGAISQKHTGWGEDLSPAFQIAHLAAEAVSL